MLRRKPGANLMLFPSGLEKETEKSVIGVKNHISPKNGSMAASAQI